MAPGPAPASRGGLSPLVGLLAAAALAHANGLAGAFQFDDYNVIVQNPAVHSWAGWLASMPGIRPLLKLSYTASWTSGLGRVGFHAVNLAAHLAAVGCAFLLLRRRADWVGGGAAGPAALTAALVFALHPAQTEAVTYLSGRSVSLMGALYLGSILAYARGVERGSALWRAGLSPLLFGAALLVRETAWTLPLALLLWGGAPPGASWRERLGRLWVHWGVLAGVGVGMLATAGYRRLLLGSLSARTLKENLLTQVDGVCYLLTQPLLLLQVNIDPDLPSRTHLTADLALRGGLLLALALAGCLQLRRRPWLGGGILWLFLHLCPTNSLLPRLDVANDRQLYLGLLGPALILAVTLGRWLPRRGAAVAAALALLLGGATVVRNLDYRTEVALWQATVRSSPEKARAWNNLGYAHQMAGELEAARQVYRRALALDPGLLKARANLGALPPGR